jgi:phosphoribosyl 1,2-cyclic phosphate phosphodiesterase
VPQIGCHCAVCRSPDPRDRRTRVGAVIETDGGTKLLLDTPPELRLQLIAADIDDVDAVFYTHAHADHTHGLDDLRAISVRRGGALPVYGPAETIASLVERFPYVFDDAMKPIPGTTKPEARAQGIMAGEHVIVGDADVEPIAIPHGHVACFGYRVGPVGYVTDAKSVPDAAIDALRGVKVLVLNALFHREHPTHLSIREAVRTAESIGAERTYFTHLTHENFHADLEAELPRGITPAFDGLTVRIDTP